MSHPFHLKPCDRVVMYWIANPRSGVRFSSGLPFIIYSGTVAIWRNWYTLLFVSSEIVHMDPEYMCMAALCEHRVSLVNKRWKRSPPGLILVSSNLTVGAVS